LQKNSFDIVISNGAFCLIPDKKKAFAQVYQMLKPGGRMVICTSTMREQLTEGVNWPVCMRMFIEMNKLKPLCEEIGFENVRIDTSNSEMEFDLPEDVVEMISEEEDDAADGTKGVSTF